jgi:hypothetical protein
MVVVKKHSGFRRDSGCFKCQECGKLTRDVDCNAPYCVKCFDRLGHENSHADNCFANDDCGEKNCSVKHYTRAQRWWL